MGFAVLTAMDGEQAVEVVRRHGAQIRAIILDLTMPNLDGAAALDRSAHPARAKVILSSGYDEAKATRCVAKERLAGFIRKPYPLDQLRSALERVLETRSDRSRPGCAPAPLRLPGSSRRAYSPVS